MSSSFTGPGPNEVSVLFSDSAITPVTTVTGVNDVLGVVTVSPGSDLTGPITISFDSSSGVNYFSEGLDTLPGPVTVDQGMPPPPTVPTPAGWLSMAIGALILAGRERLKKRQRTSLAQTLPPAMTEPAETSVHPLGYGQDSDNHVSRFR
ncbi:MAG TPA: hypothetical protein VG122_24010, partial [Gemmata sp.]|jgi:hypothetical protein|nr:hypothetical protein [Gemmata sp.]